MVKRSRLEIIKDILGIIRSNHGSIKYTPLLRKSNISSSRFKEYYQDLISKDFIEVKNYGKDKSVCLTEKGSRFLEKYRAIVNFIDEFEL